MEKAKRWHRGKEDEGGLNEEECETPLKWIKRDQGKINRRRFCNDGNTRPGTQRIYGEEGKKKKSTAAESKCYRKTGSLHQKRIAKQSCYARGGQRKSTKNCEWGESIPGKDVSSGLGGGAV